MGSKRKDVDQTNYVASWIVQGVVDCDLLMDELLMKGVVNDQWRVNKKINANDNEDALVGADEETTEAATVQWGQTERLNVFG